MLLAIPDKNQYSFIFNFITLQKIQILKAGSPAVKPLQEKIQSINCIWFNEQFLYLSDVRTVNGKSIDDKYWHIQPSAEKWSNLTLSQVYQALVNVALWQQTLEAIAPYQHLPDWLGKWNKATHKVREWRFEPTDQHLYRHTSQRTDRYGTATNLYQAYLSYH